MSQKTVNALAGIIKWGLFVLPAAALVVSSTFWGNPGRDLGTFAASVLLPGIGDLFFPFITGKNFFFRIAVEILFILWVLVATFDRRFRPNFSLVFYFLTFAVVVLALATFFGADPTRSFWSNFERMEGLLGYLHLLLFFIVLVSILRTEENWRWFFFASIFVSVLVGIYAAYQLAGRLDIHQGGTRIDATLGNATYLAVYLLFHLFILIYYLLTTTSIGWRVFYSAVFALHAFLLYQTATRGAIFGFLGGLALFAILQGILSKEKVYRLSAAGLIILMVLAASAFYFVKDTEFVKNNNTLSRFRDISFTDNTTNSRLILAQMALEGFRDRPILGWGPDNFILVFSKYYDPRMWRQEPWFDRAHSVIFDWLISAGLFGLVAYIGLFASAVFLLWRRILRKGMTVATSVFTALFAGYFFQNLFVFDNLMSSFLFTAVLGFIHFLAGNSQKAQLAPANGRTIPSVYHYVFSAASVFILVLSLYFLNFKPLWASRTLLDALKVGQEGNIEATISRFEDAIARSPMGVTESREQLAAYTDLVLRSSLPNEAKAKVVEKAASEMKKQLEDRPTDVRGYMFLAQLYLNAGRFPEAAEILNSAHKLSPRRPQILFMLTEAYINSGKVGEAFDTMVKAYDLEPNYPESVKNLALLSIAIGRADYAEGLVEKLYGRKIIADRRFTNAYARVGRYDRVRDVWLSIIEESPKDLNTQSYVSLSATYIRLGDRGKAIEAVQKAIERNSSFKEEGERLLADIKAGRSPE